MAKLESQTVRAYTATIKKLETHLKPVGRRVENWPEFLERVSDYLESTRKDFANHNPQAKPKA